MNYLIEFPFEDGNSVIVEVNELEPAGGITRVGRADEIAKASQTFESAIERIKPGAEVIIAKLRSLSEPPDEVEVAFGLKLDAKIGAFIASSGIEANYTVTLKWKRE